MAHICMLRCSFFLEAEFEVVLTAIHVLGVDNGPADAISRNNLDVFSLVLFPRLIKWLVRSQWDWWISW